MKILAGSILVGFSVLSGVLNEWARPLKELRLGYIFEVLGYPTVRLYSSAMPVNRHPADPKTSSNIRNKNVWVGQRYFRLLDLPVH